MINFHAYYAYMKYTNGEIKEWTIVMIPKVIKSIDDADNLLKATKSE